MENWGLLTFDEASLLLEPEDELTEKRVRILAVIAHEVGHQWFGNLVTMSWWNNIWLNEGLASYFELGIINYFYPKLPKGSSRLGDGADSIFPVCKHGSDPKPQASGVLDNSSH